MSRETWGPVMASPFRASAFSSIKETLGSQASSISIKGAFWHCTFLALPALLKQSLRAWVQPPGSHVPANWTPLRYQWSLQLMALVPLGGKTFFISQDADSTGRGAAPPHGRPLESGDACSCKDIRLCPHPFSQLLRIL